MESSSPLIVVDINIGSGQGIKRLAIYDDDNPLLIAKTFSQRFDLNETKE